MWLFKIAEQYYLRDGKKIRTPKKLSSKGERIVASTLEKHGIAYEAQYRFHCLHTDFAIRKGSRLYFIEYDGAQHFRPVKKFGGVRSFIVQYIHDWLFNVQCKDEGIKLLRIRYDIPYSNIEEMILDFLEIE